jgi:hypothetical protein
MTMEDEPSTSIEEVQAEVHASLERAREMLSEAKLALRQAASTPLDQAGASPASSSVR